MMNWKQMWKEAVVACLNVLLRHLLGGTEKNHENLMISGCQTEIRTYDLPNTKQE
jgi:hypothetical protein